MEVLIETSWNVKTTKKISEELDISINRNIVECKVAQFANSGANAGSINRNIVECKGCRNS